MNLKNIFFVVIAFTFLISCNSELKPRRIGKQTWASKNLNVSHFRNGDYIYEAKSVQEWRRYSEQGLPAWCYFENNPENESKLGKLYNWYAVTDSRGLAPNGWHVPSYHEWVILIEHLGGSLYPNGNRSYNLESRKVAEPKMKSASHWDGTNKSGFSALPNGFRNNRGQFFYKSAAYWWTSTYRPTNSAIYISVGDRCRGLIWKLPHNQGSGMGIRLIQD